MPQETQPIQPIKPVSAGVNLFGTNQSQAPVNLPFNGSDLGLNYVPATLHDPTGLEDYLNENQGKAHTFANWAGQTLGNTVLGTVESLSYLGDLEQWGNVLQGQEQEYNNWLAEAMQSAKENLKEAAPIYRSKEGQETFSPGSRSFWTSNTPDVIGSVLSLLIPATVAGKLGKGASALAGFGKTGQAVAELGTTVLASRWAENSMEANQVFQDMIAKGADQETAGQAAARTFNANWILALQDAFQYGTLLKGLKSATKAKSALGIAGETTAQMISEGAEEGLQFIFSEEAKRAGLDRNHGYFDSAFWQESLGDYIRSDEFKTNVSLGALGGGIFSGAVPATSNLIEQSKFYKDKIFNKEKANALEAIAKERANLVNDFGTSKKIDSDRLTKSALEHLSNNKIAKWQETVEQLKSTPGIESDVRQTLDDHQKDIEFLIDTNTKVKNSNVPKELQSQAVADRLDLRQTVRLGKELGKKQQEIYQELEQNSEITLPQIKQLQVVTSALEALSKENSKFQEEYSQSVAQLNQAVEQLSPEDQKKVTEQKAVSKEKELVTLTKQLFLAQDKVSKLKESITSYSTPEGQEKKKEEQKKSDEEKRVKNLVNKADVSKQELQKELESTQDETSRTAIQNKLSELKEQGKEKNKEAIQEFEESQQSLQPEAITQPTGEEQLQPEELSYEQDYNFEPDYESQFNPEQTPEPDFEPTSFSDFNQKTDTPELKLLRAEEPKDTKEEARKANIRKQQEEKQAEANREKGTAPTWLKVWQTASAKDYKPMFDEQGNRIYQQYTNTKTGEKKSVLEVFLTDESGKHLWSDFPSNKIGQKVLLEVVDDGKTNTFPWVLNPDFKPTGQENWVINVYLANEDGTKQLDFKGEPLKPVAQMSSEDNERTTDLSAKSKLRRAVIESPTHTFVTEITSVNMGEPAISNKENSLSVFEVDAYKDQNGNWQYGRIPHKPIVLIHKGEGQLLGNLENNPSIPKDIADELLHNSTFSLLQDTLQGSTYVARRSNDGRFVSVKVNPRKLNDKEKQWLKDNLVDSIQTVDGENKLKELVVLQSTFSGIFKDWKTKGSKLNRNYFYVIKNTSGKKELLIPVPFKTEKGETIQAWAKITSQADMKAMLANKPFKYTLVNDNNTKIEHSNNVSPEITQAFEEKLNYLQANIDVRFVNQPYPYKDVFDQEHPSYWDYLVANNIATTNNPSDADGSSLSRNKATIRLNPDGAKPVVQVIKEEIQENELAVETETKQEKPKEKSALELLEDFNGELLRPVLSEGFSIITEKELQWFKDNIGEEFLEVAKGVDRIYSKGGQEAFGIYYNGLARVAQFSPEGTAIEEGGHLHFDLVLSDNQREGILNQASKIYGIERSFDSKNVQEKLRPVDYALKSIDILKSPKADEIFRKGDKNNWSLDKILQELQIPKEQQELIKSFNTRNREEILTSLLANYSYTIEVNTAKELPFRDEHAEFGESQFSKEELKEMGWKEPQIQPTQYYSNLTVPGGTNYTENEIATPAITPSIKGHAQFSTDNGIGWFRSDDKDSSTNPSEWGKKIRRILEVQSDLFQKGRGGKDLVALNIQKSTIDSQLNRGVITQEEYNDYLNSINRNSGKNQFLQLLNKDNNWVTFFIKSIIQDTAKKGYEKVLFPKGDTASKIEGHQTLEEFKKQKEARIKELETASILKNKTVDGFYYIQRYLEDENGNEVLTWRKVSNETGREKTATVEEINELKERFSDETKNEINQLKQELERVQKEGFAALRPIYKFYEETVGNILKKNFKVKEVKDEYGNSWLELTITPDESKAIRLSTEKTEYYKTLTKDVQLEEKLMADLRTYVLNYINTGKLDFKLSGKKSTSSKIKRFFNQFLQFLRNLIGWKSPIERMFRDIATKPLTEQQRQKIRNTVAARQYYADEKLRPVPNFPSAKIKNQTIQAVKQEIFDLALQDVNTWNETVNVQDPIQEFTEITDWLGGTFVEDTTKDGVTTSKKVSKIADYLERVKAKYEKDFLAIHNNPARTNKDVAKYILYLGMGVKPADIEVEEQYNKYINSWEDVKTGDDVVSGFKSEVIKSFKELGFTVRNEEDESITPETVNEHIHGLNKNLVNPKDSLSPHIRMFLETIQDPSGATNILGNPVRLDGAQVYKNLKQWLAGKDVLSTLQKLGENGNNIAKVVNDTLVAHDNKDPHFHRLISEFQKAFSLGERYSITVDTVEGKVYNSNRNSLANILPKQWREQAVRTKFIDDTGKVDTARAEKIYNRIKALPTKPVSDQNKDKDAYAESLITELQDILKSIGITLPEQVYTDIRNPKVFNQERIPGMKKDRMVSLVLGEQRQSLQALFKGFAEGEDMFLGTKTLLTTLANLSKNYVNDISGSVYVDAFGNTVHPIGLPSYLEDINRDKEGFISKFAQDKMYTENEYIRHLKTNEAKFLEVREAKFQKETLEPGDRTNQQSLVTKIVAYRNGTSKTTRYIPVVTPSDKEHPWVVELAHKALGKEWLTSVLNNLMLAEKYRIKTLKSYENYEGNDLTLNHLKNYAKNGTKFNYIPELNQIEGLADSILEGEVTVEQLKGFYPKINDAIQSHIDTNYKAFLEMFQDEGLITISTNKAGELTYTEQKPFPKQINVSLKEMFYDTYGWMLSMQQVLMGDLAGYKDPKDFFKRAYQLSTPGSKAIPNKAGNVGTTIRTGYFADHIKIMDPDTAKAIEKFLGGNAKAKETVRLINQKNHNMTDAISFGHIGAKRKLGQGAGWSNAEEKLWQFAWQYNQTVNEALKRPENQNLTDEQIKAWKKLGRETPTEGMKPFLYKDNLITLPNGEKFVIKEQVKDSIFFITPELAFQHPGLKNMWKTMTDNSLDILSSNSAHKMGTLKDEFLLDTKVENKLLPFQVRTHDASEYRFPQELPKDIHHTTSASQLMKTILTNIQAGIKYYIPGKKEAITGEEFVRTFQGLLAEKTTAAYNEVLNELGIDHTLTLSQDQKKRGEQIKKIKALIADELLNKSLSPVYEEAIELKRELDKLDFDIHLGFPVLSKSFSSLLNNYFAKKVLKQKYTGMEAVNIPDTQYLSTDKEGNTTVKNELDWVNINEDGSLKPAEVAMSIDAFKDLGLKYGTHILPDGRVVESQLSEAQKQGLEVIVFRIPTSGDASSMPSRVAKILPSGYKNYVMLSYGFGTQQGLDFDKDDSHILIRPTKEGKIDNDHVDTKIFNMVWAKLTNPAHGHSLLRPIDTSLVDKLHEIMSDKGLITKPNPNVGVANLASDQAAELRNKEATRMIGIIALARTAHGLLQHIQGSTTSKVRINIKAPKPYQLGFVENMEGEDVDQAIQQFMQAIIDNAKDPKMSDLNWQIFTLPAALTLILHGVPGTTAAYFMKQPIVTAWLNNYKKTSDKKTATKDTLAQNNLENVIRQVQEKPIELTKDSLFQFTEVKDNPLKSAQILNDFLHYLEAGNALSDLTAVLSVDTFKKTNKFEDIEDLLEKKSRVTSGDELITLNSNLFDPSNPASLPVRSVATYFKYGIEAPIKFSQNFFAESNNSFTQAKKQLKLVLGSKRLKAKTRGIFNTFLNYWLLQENNTINSILDKFSPNRGKRWTYTVKENSILSYINKEIVKDPSLAKNALIKSLQYVEEKKEGYLVGLTNTTGDNSNQEIMDGWRDLLNSSKPEHKLIGYDLIRYAIFTSGLQYGPYSFFESIPPEFYVQSGLKQAHQNILNGLLPADDTGITYTSIPEGAILSFIRHKYKVLDEVPAVFYREGENGIYGIKNAKKEGNKVVEFDLPEDHWTAERGSGLSKFVKMESDGKIRLYEMSPVLPGHYKEIQPLGTLYRFIEVSDSTGREASKIKENEGLPQPYLETSKITPKGIIESKEVKPSNKVEEFIGFWTREQIASQPNKVFLFGDNTNDRTVTKYVPSMTQAVIRGLSNAIGIDTKKDRGTSSTSYFTDKDFDWFKNHVDTQIQKAKDSGKTIVIPADGIGTGKAMLKDKAPKLFEYLQQELSKLKQSNSSSKTSYPLIGEQGENPFITKYIQSDSESVASVLGILEQNEADIENKEVIAALKRNVQKINSPVQLVEMEGKLGEFEVSREGNSTVGVIKINPNGKVQSDKQFRTVLLHEINHAYSVRILDNPETEQEKNFARNIERIQKEAQKRLGNIQGTENKYEFLATLASDSNFRNKLRKTENLFQRIIRYFRNLLGLSEKYDAVLSNYYNILDSAENLQSSQEGQYPLEEKKPEDKKTEREIKKNLSLVEKLLEFQQQKIHRLHQNVDTVKLAKEEREHLDTFKKYLEISKHKAVLLQAEKYEKEITELEQALPLMKVAPEKVSDTSLNGAEQQVQAYTVIGEIRKDIKDHPSTYGLDEKQAKALVSVASNLLSRALDLKNELREIRLLKQAKWLNEVNPEISVDTHLERLKLAERGDISVGNLWMDHPKDVDDPLIQEVAFGLKQADANSNEAAYEFMNVSGEKKKVKYYFLETNDSGKGFHWNHATYEWTSVSANEAEKNYRNWLKVGNKSMAFRDLFAPLLDKDSFKEDSDGIKFIAPNSVEGRAILNIKEGSPDYAKRQMYETLVFNYLIAQQDITPSARPGMRIPSIGRTTLEGLMTGGRLDLLKEGLINSVSLRYDEQDFKPTREDGSQNNFIPLRFISKQDGQESRYKKNEISLDLLNTIGIAYAEAARRRSLKQSLDKAELIKRTIEERDIAEVGRIEAAGIAPFTTRSRNLKVTTAGEVALSRKSNREKSNASKLIGSLLDRQYYGQFKEESANFKMFGINFNLRKMSDLFLKYTGMKFMFGNIAIPLTNLSVGQLTMGKEAIGGNLINEKNWLAGWKLYSKEVLAALWDVNNKQKKSKIMRVLQFFNPTGENRPLDHTTIDNNWMIRTMGTLFHSNITGFNLISTASGAIFDKHKVEKDGKKRSFYEGIEVDMNGKITLSKGFTYNGKKELDSNDVNSIRNEVQRLYQVLHGGAISRAESPLWQSTIVGSMLGFMRTWLTPGFNARWQLKRPDKDFKQDVEGYYVSSLIIFNNILTGEDSWFNKTARSLKVLTFLSETNPEVLLNVDEVDLPQEKKDELIKMRLANMRKTRLELYLIAGITLSMMLAFGDDDDDSYVQMMMTRVRRELLTFLSPLTAWDVLRSPSVSMGAAEGIMKAIGSTAQAVGMTMTPDAILETLHVDTEIPKYSKGIYDDQYKWWADIQKATPGLRQRRQLSNEQTEANNKGMRMFN